MNKILSIIALCAALLSVNVYAHDDHGVISGQKALKTLFNQDNEALVDIISASGHVDLKSNLIKS